MPVTKGEKSESLKPLDPISIKDLSWTAIDIDLKKLISEQRLEAERLKIDADRQVWESRKKRLVLFLSLFTTAIGFVGAIAALSAGSRNLFEDAFSDPKVTTFLSVTLALFLVLTVAELLTSLLRMRAGRRPAIDIDYLRKTEAALYSQIHEGLKARLK